MTTPNDLLAELRNYAASLKKAHAINRNYTAAQIADELQAILSRHTECSDCVEAKKLAYSDATTPGFHHDTCEKHRPDSMKGEPRKDAERGQCVHGNTDRCPFCPPEPVSPFTEQMEEQAHDDELESRYAHTLAAPEPEDVEGLAKALHDIFDECEVDNVDPKPIITAKLREFLVGHDAEHEADYQDLIGRIKQLEALFDTKYDRDSKNDASLVAAILSQISSGKVTDIALESALSDRDKLLGTPMECGHPLFIRSPAGSCRMCELVAATVRIAAAECDKRDNFPGEIQRRILSLTPASVLADVAEREQQLRERGGEEADAIFLNAIMTDKGWELCDERIPKALQEREQAAIARARLEARIDERKQHGNHFRDCKYYLSEPCSCGFFERTEELQNQKATLEAACRKPEGAK